MRLRRVVLRLVLALSLLLAPASADAAIAVDATSTGGFSIATSQTWSHTCTGSDGILWVGVLSNAANVTGVTYNGVALTQQGTTLAAAGGTYHTSLWRLVAPATGANNIVVTSSSSQDLYSVAASYTGVDQTTPIDVSNQTADTVMGGVTTRTLTTTIDLDWLVMFTFDQTALNATAGANTTIRIRNSTFNGIFLSDTNADQTPAGSHSLVINNAGTFSNDIYLAMRPVGGGGGLVCTPTISTLGVGSCG